MFTSSNVEDVKRYIGLLINKIVVNTDQTITANGFFPGESV